MFVNNSEFFARFDMKSLEDTDDEEILSKDIEETLKVVIDTFAKVFEVETKEINKDTHFLYDLSGSSIQYFSLLTERFVDLGQTLGTFIACDFLFMRHGASSGTVSCFLVVVFFF